MLNLLNNAILILHQSHAVMLGVKMTKHIGGKQHCYDIGGGGGVIIELFLCKNIIEAVTVFMSFPQIQKFSL